MQRQHKSLDLAYLPGSGSAPVMLCAITMKILANELVACEEKRSRHSDERRIQQVPGPTRLQTWLARRNRKRLVI